MSGEVALVATSVARNRVTLEGLAQAIDALGDLGSVREARARIEALRAWAKVHNQLREVRVDLLKAEIAALVRIVELEGLDELPPAERKAAQHLAGMSARARAALIADSAEKITTAAGMVRALWAMEQNARNEQAQFTLGRRAATNPGLPTDKPAEIADVLRQIVEDYSEAGEHFTVASLADELIESARIPDWVEADEAMRLGVREVVRAAIMRAPTLYVDGTALPRLVTATTENGDYVRIPVENATLAHLDQMRDLRREQIDQDQAALRRLDVVAGKLRAVSGSSDTSRIGDLLAVLLGKLESRRSA